jgi:hypothetical protein
MGWAGLSAAVAPTSFTGDGTNGFNGQLYQVYSFTSTTSAQSFDLSGVDLARRLGATINGPVSGSGSLTYEEPGRLTLANNWKQFFRRHGYDRWQRERGGLPFARHLAGRADDQWRSHLCERLVRDLGTHR